MSLGTAHKTPAIGCCTSKGIWEKPVIHLSASKIYIHAYIPTHVSPQQLVTYVSVTLCLHCMSLFGQHDKERFEWGFKSSAGDEHNRGCPHQCCEGKAKKQQDLKGKKKINKKICICGSCLKNPTQKDITCCRGYTSVQTRMSSWDISWV